MKLHWIPLLIALAVLLAIDFFAYRRLRRSAASPRWAKPCYAAASALLYAVLGAALIFAHQDSDAGLRVAMYLLLAFFGIQGSKLVAMLIGSLSLRKNMEERGRQFIRFAAVGVMTVLLLKLAWATLVTPFQIQVNHITIESERVPEAFDGYRIVQFSDAHLGTYGTDTAFVSQYVDSINAQQPHMICFTGDLVNRHSREVDAFVPVLRRLRAADGVIAAQGNHDQKFYYRWPSEQAWLADSLRLHQQQRIMGWTPCVDSCITVHRGADSILVVGMQSFMPPHWKLPIKFKDICASSYQEGTFKILLQHVPNVWKYYIDPKSEGEKDNPVHIDLTLAGHTHAMQMQFTLFGTQFSPASFVTPYWAGHYSEGDQHLYVNTGVGEVGVPMRIGVTPEITVITLKKKH
ncbi:MAG: metallophosphoesterase [Bacteroidales bacterium]|nr:metallophosphoesterase [Bacteroidales bacterium]